ncbi:hypothetical protein [Allobaculum sp. Allo2]|nr:hypothetical protein [Allobaculum sp. Allo2]
MDYDTTGIEKKQDDSYETLITAQKSMLLLAGKRSLKIFRLQFAVKEE